LSRNVATRCVIKQRSAVLVKDRVWRPLTGPLHKKVSRCLKEERRGEERTGEERKGNERTAEKRTGEEKRREERR
jgi:hypothetical protein